MKNLTSLTPETAQGTIKIQYHQPSKRYFASVVYPGGVKYWATFGVTKARPTVLSCGNTAKAWAKATKASKDLLHTPEWYAAGNATTFPKNLKGRTCFKHASTTVVEAATEIPLLEAE